jgi:hypothetical protein
MPVGGVVGYGTMSRRTVLPHIAWKLRGADNLVA